MRISISWIVNYAMIWVLFKQNHVRHDDAHAGFNTQQSIQQFFDRIDKGADVFA